MDKEGNSPRPVGTSIKNERQPIGGRLGNIMISHLPQFRCVCKQQQQHKQIGTGVYVVVGINICNIRTNSLGSTRIR